MRIAVIVSTFPPYRGGMGNMARSYADGLSRLGHDVTVFCPAYRPAEKEPDAPYRVRRMKPPVKFRNSAFLPQLGPETRGFDLVNLHYPFFGGAEAVLLNKKTLGRRMPLVVNYQMDPLAGGWAGAAMAAYTKTVLPAVLKAADRVIVTSLDYAAHSAAAPALRRHPEKFEAVPPGVDTSVFKPRPIDPAVMETLWNPREKAGVQRMLTATASGSLATVQRQLKAIIDETGANELIVAGAIHSHAARLRSYELLATLAPSI